MGDEAPNSQVAHDDTRGVERLVFFSDAVFAVAITLLALDIRLPPSEHLSEGQLQRALVAIAPKYLAYLVSFVAVGLIWLGHHRKFQFIRRHDAILLRINLLLLMVVALVPFATSVLSESFYPTSVILYSCVMCALSLLSAAVWAWAARATPHLLRNEPLPTAAQPARAAESSGGLRLVRTPCALGCHLGSGGLDFDYSSHDNTRIRQDIVEADTDPGAARQ